LHGIDVFELILICGSLLLAALATGWARRMALAHAVLDLPNERSSHSVATPRGGGIAIVFVVTAAAVALGAAGLLPLPLCYAVLGGLVVAAAGFADDRRPLRPAVRLAAHFAAALWAVYWLGGLPALQIGAHAVQLQGVGYCIAVLTVVWTLNLFNFMDGIDGIAATEAIFIAAAGAIIGIGGSASPAGTLGIVLAAACAGFLLWNWPPAKIFLGDVGSGYIGYVLSVLALSSGHQNPVNAWVWLLLGGAFFADATVTLTRRTLRHERVHVAHRTHAYQHLALRWRSHFAVTASLALVNLLVLLPCALLARRFPAYAATITLATLVALGLAVWLLGAGQDESAGADGGLP
jgi:Fuc2NAc and GlcNAc transferase